MSILEVLSVQNDLKSFIDRPRAFVLMANPVWGSAETMNGIALFDSEEALLAYVEGSRLLESVTTADGIRRTFRPDSLLYDYNDPLQEWRGCINPMVPWEVYDGLTQNPLPPFGPMPELRLLTHPRYGQDYDVGYGPPRVVEEVVAADGVVVVRTKESGYTDMDGEVPTVPDPSKASQEKPGSKGGTA